MENESKWLSPIIIFMAFIFCWPVGVVLLYLKYFKNFKIEKQSKIAVLQRKQKNNQLLGIVFLIITLVFVSVTLPDTEMEWSERIGDSILFIALFGIPAYVFFNKAKKLKNTVDKVIEYNDLIVIRNITSIQELSDRLSVSKEQVLKFVSEMIRQKQLEGYIKNEKEIILNGRENIHNIKSIRCTSCGAKNKFITGENNICEYCGTVLN